MNKVVFEIERIYAGWFEVWCKTDKKEVYFTASDAWETDSPKCLLLMLADLMRRKTGAGYVIFDEEPGTYVLCIEKNDKCLMEIFYSKSCDDELEEGERYGNLSREETKKLIPVSEVLFSEEDMDLDLFIETVLRSFEEYEKGRGLEEYEENWMAFPRKELEILRALYQENAQGNEIG